MIQLFFVIFYLCLSFALAMLKMPIYTTVFIDLLMIGLILFWVRRKKIELFRGSISHIRVLRFTVLGVLVYVVLANIGGALVHFGFNPMVDDYLAAIRSVPLVLYAFVSVIIAPIFEEFLFRLVLLQPIVKRLERGDLTATKQAFLKYGSVVCYSLLFGVIHGTMYHLVIGSLFGALLGIVYIKTKNIFDTITMHVVYNMCAFFGIGLLVSTNLLVVLLVCFGITMWPPFLDNRYE